MKLPDWKESESHKKFYKSLKEFRDNLKKADKIVDFKKSARGWGYYLENEDVISKQELDKAETAINKLRKNNYGIDCSLPLDFTAQDDARTWYCDDYGGSYENPKHYIKLKGGALVDGRSFDGRCFWDSQNVFIQCLVEKIDLVSLFKPICDEYNIPIATSKGWSSLNQRGDIATRFHEWQKEGKKPVLLYCGDHDPAGLHISDTLRDNLEDLQDSKVPDGNGGYITGWTPDQVTIDRFGLSKDFIEKYGITWIDNLETDSSGNGPDDLANPKHEDHDKDYVQDYIEEFGTRKVEANAMVTKPDASQELFRDTVESYLGENPKEQYHSDLEQDKEQIREVIEKYGIDESVEDAIHEMSEGK